MGILAPAFNALARLHSRAATLKRLGTPDLYSAVRIMPSNYFRFLEGPSQSVIRGREFIIPLESIVGTAVQVLGLDGVPTEGSFKLSYNGNETSDMAFDATASDIQTALRLLTGLQNVTVEGSFDSESFSIAFVGIDNPYLLEFEPVTGDEIDTSGVVIHSARGLAWPNGRIRRGDRLVDEIFGSLAVDEIIEMYDFGGDVLGFRVRVE